MASYISISMRAGDTLVIDFALQTPDGQPIDLTGATLKWGFRPSPLASPSEPLLTKTTDGGGIAIAGDDHHIARVRVGKGEVPAGRFVHELEVTLADGDSFTAANGPLEAVAAVFS